MTIVVMPMLILRRAESNKGAGEMIRGEFLLSDHSDERDLLIVRPITSFLPLKSCEHVRSLRHNFRAF